MPIAKPPMPEPITRAFLAMLCILTSVFGGYKQRELQLTQVATYKIPANFLKLWAKMNPHTLSTKPWRVVA